MDLLYIRRFDIKTYFAVSGRFFGMHHGVPRDRRAPERGCVDAPLLPPARGELVLRMGLVPMEVVFLTPRVAAAFGHYGWRIVAKRFLEVEIRKG